MVNQVHAIPLGDIDGWLFRQGNGPGWEKDNIDMKNWQPLKPIDISKKLVDKSGRLEGWLRLEIKADTAFGKIPFDINLNLWAATDLYLDGNLLYSFGNTGSNGKPYREYNPMYKLPLAFNIKKDREHLLALHIVDYLSPLPPYNLKSSIDRNSIIICLPAYKSGLLNEHLTNITFKTIWISVNIILCCLFWLLAFQNKREKNIMLISITSTAFAIAAITDGYIPFPGLGYYSFRMLNIAWSVFLPISFVLIIIILVRIFERPVTRPLKWLLALVVCCAPLMVFYSNQWILIFETFIVDSIYTYYILTTWKKLKGAQWIVLVGILLSMILGLLLATITIFFGNISRLLTTSLYTGIFLSSPLSLIVYVSMRFKEIIKEVHVNAREVVKLSEEKKVHAENQQKILQEEVNKQTAELRHTLENLQSTQKQLLQSEKIASLGELTAGIAHEIQNPLNFVNNFSDVNKELLQELKEEAGKGNMEDVKAIADDVMDNEEKINHHGKRADAIVRGMLQHSRKSSGQKEPTDINALADEYLKLSYHGLRAKDKTFNAVMKTDFDSTIEKINIIPQDIGRVLLNLYNNAFYAVKERFRQAQHDTPYEPTVSVTTKKSESHIIITVSDNGNGIPEKLKDKIFQPFFTTKPTGQGTGLGLSLSYDIIKAHRGELKVETKEDEETVFIVVIPA